MNTKELVRTGIIYLITFPNGKYYVGQTVKSLSHRINGYRKEINCTANDRPVVLALRKYGISNCSFESIVTLSNTRKEVVDKAEKEQIIKFDSLVHHNGYNIHEGGSGGDNFTNHPNREEIRKKYQGKQRRLGAKLSQETKDKIGTKAKERLKDKTRHPLWGKHHSTETKKKLSESKKGKIPSCTKFRKPLTKMQLIQWFKADKNYRWMMSKYKVSQRKIEESLVLHFGTKSLTEAKQKWKESLQE